MDLITITILSVSMLIIFSFVSSKLNKKKNDGPTSLVDSVRSSAQYTIGASIVETKLSTIERLSEARTELKMTDEQLTKKLSSVSTLLRDQ